MKFTEQNYLEKYDTYLFFYNGFLSNWHDSPFIDQTTRTSYNCSEQYMMEKKARLFGDSETASKILLADHPSEQKKLGRLVQNFDKSIWDQVAREIVYKGCFLKFTQNRDAYEYLISTDGQYLVEASPTDIVWGVGLGGYDPAIQDSSNWRGTNWLGQVLTSLREDLLTY